VCATERLNAVVNFEPLIDTADVEVDGALRNRKVRGDLLACFALADGAQDFELGPGEGRCAAGVCELGHEFVCLSGAEIADMCVVLYTETVRIGYRRNTGIWGRVVEPGNERSNASSPG
jgi:hypothetical protein